MPCLLRYCANTIQYIDEDMDYNYAAVPSARTRDTFLYPSVCIKALNELNVVTAKPSGYYAKFPN